MEKDFLQVSLLRFGSTIHSHGNMHNTKEINTCKFQARLSNLTRNTKFTSILMADASIYQSTLNWWPTFPQYKHFTFFLFSLCKLAYTYTFIILVAIWGPRPNHSCLKNNNNILKIPDLQNGDWNWESKFFWFILFLFFIFLGWNFFFWDQESIVPYCHMDWN